MLRYTSLLKPEYSEDLEQLLFFNPGQHTALDVILESLKQFGAPGVYADGECLRVKLEKLNEVQTLFALDDDALVGVLVYSRIALQSLTVIHIAVTHDYSSHGKFSHHMLVIRMLYLLRSSARRIKGVESIRIMYSGNRTRDYPV